MSEKIPLSYAGSGVDIDRADLVKTKPRQIQGLAHITGGGMPGKLPKPIPEGLGALIEVGSWPVHPTKST